MRAWPQFQQSDWVLTYMPMRSEVDLTGLLSHYPHKGWIIPRILPASRMQFHRYDPEKLILHKFGMLEPDPASPLISPQEIQLVLVPGLAYDREGWRLGYGGGFYDRFLAEFKGISVGVTFQKLVLPSIPHQGHDIPMQYLVSEQGLLNTMEMSKPEGK